MHFQICIVFGKNVQNLQLYEEAKQFDYVFFSEIVSFWYFCVDVKCLQKHRRYLMKTFVTVYWK